MVGDRYHVPVVHERAGVEAVFGEFGFGAALQGARGHAEVVLPPHGSGKSLVVEGLDAAEHEFLRGASGEIGVIAVGKARDSRDELIRRSRAQVAASCKPAGRLRKAFGVVEH